MVARKTAKSGKRIPKPRADAKKTRAIMSRAVKPTITDQVLAEWSKHQRSQTAEAEIALRHLRDGLSQRRSAQLAGISVGRFRTFVRKNKLAKRKGRRWIITDRRVREVAVIVDGEELLIKVRGFEPASLAMRHRSAVKEFLDTNDAILLQPFLGKVVSDTSKRKFLLETRPNVLLRHANAGSDADLKIYRLLN